MVNLTAWYWKSFKPWKKATKAGQVMTAALSSTGHDDDGTKNRGWDQKADWSQEKEVWGWDQKHDLHVWSQMEVASKELSTRKRKAAADLINIDKAQRCLQEARNLMS